MKEIAQINIQDYLEIGLRRKWLIILPFIVITLGAIVWAYQLPPIYRAGTLILIQKQRVPEAYIKPTVTTGIGERLHTISQQIMSRTRLEKIINEFDLYSDLRQSLFMEEIVTKMRKDIALEVKGGEAFELFYDGKDPKVVSMVANRLASLFIEENLKMREDLAEGTTEFLDRELLRVKKQLEEQEEAIRAFKERNIGALPEQLDANLRTLEQLQVQSQAVTTSIESAKGRKMSLQNQVSHLSGLEAQIDTDLVDIGTVESAESSPTLENLKELLSSLRVRYTEKHPDVLRVKAQIKRLEEEIQSQEEPIFDEVAEEDPYADSSPGLAHSFYDTMTLELEGVDLEISKLNKEQAKLKEKIAAYQKRIEDTPKREQQLVALHRDYGNTQKNYESLLDKRLNAQIAANMEKVQKGERFKILDPARTPQKPFKPNRKRIVLLAMLLALGCGVGLTIGAEYLDHSFRDIDDLEQYLGLQALASIPKIVTDEDSRRRKTKKRVVLASSLGLMLVTASLLIIHFLVLD
ncbi:MAG: XrtA system polysaccharide chain length determinant [Thermodesulfobacteriota bacterium]|nr:XrtA system polysaccharide chain length determinant [Thermodesulfobacteriota bacterium]